MLGVGCHRARSAEAIEFHTAGMTEFVDRFFQYGGVQLVANREQGADRRVEHLVAKIRRRVLVVHRELRIAAVRPQMLRQLQLERLEAIVAKRPAEAQHRGFTDFGTGGHIDNAHIDQCSAVVEDVIRYLALGFAQAVAVLPDLVDGVVRFHAVCSWFTHGGNIAGNTDI